jgi:hypothetical protein
MAGRRPKKVLRVKVHKDTQRAEKGLDAFEAFALDLASNRKIKAWRNSVGWSSNRLSKEMGYRGPSYIKHLESETKPWALSARAASKLSVLMQSTKPRGELEAPKKIMVFTRYQVATKMFLYLRPRRCRGHKRSCIMGPNQVYCGSTDWERAECRKVWKRRERKKLKED